MEGGPLGLDCIGPGATQSFDVIERLITNGSRLVVKWQHAQHRPGLHHVVGERQRSVPEDGSRIAARCEVRGAFAVKLVLRTAGELLQSIRFAGGRPLTELSNGENNRREKCGVGLAQLTPSCLVLLIPADRQRAAHTDEGASESTYDSRDLTDQSTWR